MGEAVASITRFHPREVRVAGMATTSTGVKGRRVIVNLDMDMAATITSQSLNLNHTGTLGLVIPLVSTEGNPVTMATSQSLSIMKILATMAVGMMMDTGS
jgi:hypothetical protein